MGGEDYDISNPSCYVPLIVVIFLIFCVVAFIYETRRSIRQGIERDNVIRERMKQNLLEVKSSSSEI